jgi:hypothetical protein
MIEEILAVLRSIPIGSAMLVTMLFVFMWLVWRE